LLAKTGACAKVTLPQKIARLVAELGWNQETFATKAGVNRNTARQILTRPQKNLHNTTLRKCADALGFSVHELVTFPVEQLIRRLRRTRPARTVDLSGLDFSQQPKLREWMQHHPDRAALLSDFEIEELLSLQGTGGPLTIAGVEHFVTLIERKRELLKRIEVICGTEYLNLLEQIVELVYHRIQPYGSQQTEVSEPEA
jgi:transcriptional regulator with XRE-family HTH domain